MFNIEISKQEQDRSNQVYLDDLKRVVRTNSVTPTHTPKKWMDCFYLYYDGSTTYELYIYINNEWKKTVLS